MTADRNLPGAPLPSGFRYRPAENVPEAQLSKEARDLVLAKMDDVDRARARAAMDARTAVIL